MFAFNKQVRLLDRKPGKAEEREVRNVDVTGIISVCGNGSTVPEYR